MREDRQRSPHYDLDIVFFIVRRKNERERTRDPNW
jgi:hypothetical protein